MEVSRIDPRATLILQALLVPAKVEYGINQITVERMELLATGPSLIPSSMFNESVPDYMPPLGSIVVNPRREIRFRVTNLSESPAPFAAILLADRRTHRE